ncbi:hypothetical protein METHP14_620020 [Pseudomonas sp. P14-2025]
MSKPARAPSSAPPTRLGAVSRMASRQHRPHRGLRSSSTWLKPLSNAVAQSGHGLTKFLVYMGQSVRLMGERWASLGLGFPRSGRAVFGEGFALQSRHKAAATGIAFPCASVALWERPCVAKGAQRAPGNLRSKSRSAAC